MQSPPVLQIPVWPHDRRATSRATGPIERGKHLLLFCALPAVHTGGDPQPIVRRQVCN